MKKIILLSHSSFSCYDAERSCKDFKTGKFKFKHEVEGIMKNNHLWKENDSLKLKL
jgi:hypothetical protein